MSAIPSITEQLHFRAIPTRLWRLADNCDFLINRFMNCLGVAVSWLLEARLGTVANNLFQGGLAYILMVGGNVDVFVV